MRILPDEALSFDDVLLVPNSTSIKSRKDVRVATSLSNGLFLPSPIISANMDTVTGADMAVAMKDIGLGIIHRFMPVDHILAAAKKVKLAGGTSVISVGIQEHWFKDIEFLADYPQYIDGICIDVAHGDTERVYDMIKRAKSLIPSWTVIAGNVATAAGTGRLIDAGADCVKVGIGPGSLCTTRVQTGCGVPQLTAISRCAVAAKDRDKTVIADGGIRTSGDIVKALAAGASAVMLGSLLSGTTESPGKIIVDPEWVKGVPDQYLGNGVKKFKEYRGMASRKAMDSWKGDASKTTTAEGESTVVPYKGDVKPIVETLLGGLRSGMTYNDATTISELQEKATFVKVSSHTVMENSAHGLNK